MIILFFTLLLAGTVLFMASRGKYGDFVKPLDKKDYPFKDLLPAGMLVLDAFKYSYISGYDRRLLTKLTELYGAERSHRYLRVHMANKIVYLLLGLLLVALVGSGAHIDAGFGVFGISVLAGIAYYSDRELDSRIRKRRTAIRMDFPDFLNKLILLINAGMTVSRAWEKAVQDNRKSSLLYAELGMVLSSVRSGTAEQKAYEDFAKRCRIPEITRFVSVILQNLRKGNSELVSVLRVFANECWDMRKNTARRLGEEASTRMILPLMLMLAAILLIVATPAVLALRGM